MYIFITIREKKSKCTSEIFSIDMNGVLFVFDKLMKQINADHLLDRSFPLLCLLFVSLFVCSLEKGETIFRFILFSLSLEMMCRNDVDNDV